MFKEYLKPQENLQQEKPKTPEKALTKPKSFFENTLDLAKSFKKTSDAFDSKITTGITKLLARGTSELSTSAIETMKALQNIGKATVEQANGEVEDARVAAESAIRRRQFEILKAREQTMTPQELEIAEKIKKLSEINPALAEVLKKRQQEKAA